MKAVLLDEDQARDASLHTTQDLDRGRDALEQGYLAGRPAEVSLLSDAIVDDIPLDRLRRAGRCEGVGDGLNARVWGLRISGSASSGQPSRLSN